MEKQKFITISVIALLLLNIGTLGFLFVSGPKQGHRPPPHGRPEPREIIIEKLHFDEQQIEAYELLIREHRKQIDAVDEKIRDTKNSLYALLNSNDSSSKDSLIIALGNYQKEIETTHFNHFAGIKKLCKPNQKSDFEELSEELSRLFSKPPRPRHE